MERRSTSSLWLAVLEAVEVAAARGLSVDAAIISMPIDTDPVPHEVSDLLAAVVIHAPSRTVSMRIFVDEGLAEVFVTAPSAAIEAAWSSLSRPNPAKGRAMAEAIVLGGLALSISEAGDRQSLVSIRRRGDAP
jgi:hypothetical protein